MVNNKILKTLTLGVCLWCVVSDTLALGLGEVEIYSALGRPLLAEIPIFDSANESLHRGSLVVGLADEATHRKVGLPYPYFLRYLKFSIDETRIDNPRIRVTSSASISEPLFHFLIEFRWPETRLLKEVTVLLDPPTGNSWFARAKQGGIAETEANERTSTAGSHLGHVRKRAPASGFDTRTYGPIASGESLSQIAAQLSRKRNTGLREMMTGLYNKNPHAFGASMDVLKRGALLDIPTAQELAQLSVAEQVPKTTTKSPGDPHSEPVSEQVALKSSGIAQLDRETAHDPGLRILSSASAATRQEHNNDMPGANPVANTFNAYTAQAIPTAHAVQTSTPSVEFRLERAARDLQMLRAENESMRKAMANMQNELLVNRDSFEKMLTKYEGLLEASQKSHSVDKVATTLPYATWVPWLTLLVAIGIIGGIGLIGLRMHKGRKHRVDLENVGAKSSVSIPLDEILDSVQSEGMLDSAPERSRIGLPQGQGYSMSQSAAGLSVSHLHETGETTVPEAPIRNDDAPMPAEINSGVIAEYLATGEFNITDANIAREIVNSEGNSEVKLVLLAFYKELGKHKDLLRLADEILARHPDDDSEFRKHVLAIRNTASEVTRRSAATHGFETRSDEQTHQNEVAHSCGNSDPSARHRQNQETAIGETSTAIYHADRRGGENMGTNPPDARCVGDSNPSDIEDSHGDEAQASRSQQSQGNDSGDTQASAQSVSEDASEWPELYDVFAPETEILEQEQALDDQHVDSALESRREAGRVTAAEVRPGDDQEPTKQFRAELDRSKEFAPGLPDPSLLDEPEQASDEEVVDTQLWVDSGAQSDTIAHNREEYAEWFRQHTGSDHKN